MKVAVFIDHLLERDPLVDFASLAVLQFKNYDIYTVASQKKAVEGTSFDLKPIKTTYLSNIVRSKKDLYDKSFLIPNALKNFPISCQYDLVFCFTEGLMAGIRLCPKNTRSFAYLAQVNFNSSYFHQSLLSRIFKKYIKNCFFKTLYQFDHLICANQQISDFILKDYSSKDVFKLDPFFDFSRFPLLPVEQRSSEQYIFYFGKNGKNTLNYKKFLKKSSQLKKECTIVEWEELPCEGTLFSELVKTKCFIDLSEQSIPQVLLTIMATGTPVAYGFEKNNYLSEDIHFFSNLNELFSKIKEINFSILSQERRRSMALKFSEIKFKSLLKNKLKKLEITL